MNAALRYKSMQRLVVLTVLIICLAAAVAFALLQSRSSLTGNTITTANANLLLSTDGVTYDHTVPGFSFAGIVPGGYPAPAGGYSIYLKNTGSTPLSLNLSLDNTPTNPGSADLTKLNFALTEATGSIPPRGYILASLTGTGQSVEGELAPGATRHYKLQALAADEAVPGATVGNINLVFTGTAHDPNAPSN